MYAFYNHTPARLVAQDTDEVQELHETYRGYYNSD